MRNLEFVRDRLTGFMVVFAALTLLVFAVGCSRESSPSAAGQMASGKQKYHCPMHPTYVSDRPGDCPICNMKLVPIKGTQAPAKAASNGARADKFAHVKPGQFYCPMHPEVVSNVFGLCPDCNMKLVEKKESPASAEVDHAEHAPQNAVPGRVSIQLSPEKRQLIGLRLSHVEKRSLSRSIRTVATVQHDETRYHRIAPRFSGWVRELYINFVGAPVEKGQPLFTVYSPEVFSAENEYLLAWRNLRQLTAGASTAQRESAEALLKSARLRLELWQVDDQEIRELEERGTASAELVFRAPVSGHVLVKNAVEGKGFMAGDSLFEIADLSHVWLIASIYEFELSLVHDGMPAVVRFPSINNRSFPAAVTFVYPHIDPQTRRGQVRLELDNPDHLLRPDMWANVELEVNLGEKLTVPSSAVIDTGQRHVIFVDGPQEHLEPREVKIGSRTDDYFEVLSGVEEGERVVTRALFLVDSESQLKAAIAGMVSGEHNH